MNINEKVKQIIVRFVGESISLACCDFDTLKIFQNNFVLGYSQFNEILLLLGFDRISQACFQFLVDGKVEFDQDQKIIVNQNSKITSIEQLENGINEFRKISILLFANIKYGFKNLARDSEELTYYLITLAPYQLSHFAQRHEPIININPIPSGDTYLLGYKINEKIDKTLKKDPRNKEALRLTNRRKNIVPIGIRNLNAYLASDHLDVYVATSMREKHEFIYVHETIEHIKKHSDLEELKLRWFDPTQSYCEDRIDKGLTEGLMLKRAKCTIYLAQESETLGKDSELASTLAQGKPVIALVPRGDKEYVDRLISTLINISPDNNKKSIILAQLRIFNSSLAWTNDSEGEKVRKWIENLSSVNESELMNTLYSTVKSNYNDRYDTLTKSHPLGIQVDLDTGVATGVLVVRDIDTCAKLVRSAVLHALEFDIVETIKKSGEEYIYLREKISNCIYRVITGEKLLTNTFWNFYLDEPTDNEVHFK